MSRKPKLKEPRTTMRFMAYDIVSDAVERGVRYGVMKAFKYADPHPTEEALVEWCERGVMDRLCEVIEFTPREDE